VGEQLIDLAARQLSEEGVVAQYRPAVYGGTSDHACRLPISRYG
jgi:hypothetical protein